MREHIAHFLKGFAMGVANVIPGVSGGTIALLTGIFERLINALKSFDVEAVRLLLKFKFKEFARHVDFGFLVAVFLGVGVSIVSVAKLLEFLFQSYPVYVWSFFFGLILVSVWFVGKSIGKIDVPAAISFVAGAVVAFGLSVMNPATENTAFWYLIICGAVAICSMILPGLSGSFVLILMGNYQLIMIYAVSHFDMGIIIPVGIGVVVGLLAFSHFLSWLLSRYARQTMAVLTGFIFGSLGTIWPWKNPVYLMQDSVEVLKNGKPIIQSYQMYFPQEFSVEVVVAILLMIAGMAALWALERSSEKAKEIQK
jgi:putative membrane protein